MEINFQTNILRYLFQNKIAYMEYLTPEIFDIVHYQEMFKLLYNYIDKHKHLPNKDNFIYYISEQQLNHNISEILTSLIDNMYEHITDIDIIERKLLSDVKKQLYHKLLISQLKNINKDTQIDVEASITQLHTKLSKITNIRTESKPGIMLLRDIHKLNIQDKQVHPFFLHGINDMTTLGGFYKPQFILIMGPPKSFKTGLMLKIAIEYMRDGLNVYYADFENGQDDIFLRAKQTLLEVELKQLGDHIDDLNRIKEKLEVYIGSGDIYIKKFLKRKENIKHVELDLIKQIDEGFKPELIMYDYIDVMGGSTDRRIASQDNYADAQNLNDMYDMFSFTVSKMKQSALDKEWPGPEDIAEDFEKIYNSHAVFALMRTEEDIINGLGSMIPIAQRQGVSYLKFRVPLEINPATAYIKELII